MADRALLDQVHHELDLARAARRRGNEGRARVCARRAGGLVARLYLEAHGIRLHGSSALEHLNRLEQQPEISPETKRHIQLLLLRVDSDFKLPAGADLIADAEALYLDLLDRRGP